MQLFSILLTVLFVVLKLTHQVAWSWAWVLAPMWGGALAAIVITILFLLVATGSGRWRV